MKYYEYKQQRENEMSKLFAKHGVFFAFSNKQINEQKEENVKYYSLGAGMFIPQDNYDSFNEEFEKSEDDYMAKAKEIFTPEEIIRYELANHEYCITYDLTDTKEVLEEFNFSDENYRAAIKEYLSDCES